MKIGCISWSHRNDFANDKMDLIKWMEHCKKDAGVDGVEVWNNHFTSLGKEYLETLHEKSKELDLPIYSIATKCIFGSFTVQEIEKAQQTMRDWLEATDYLGASIMRISVGGDDLRNLTHQEMVFTALTEVIKECKYTNIQVGIENQEPGVVQNIEDVELMVKKSDGLLKLVLDNGSFINKQTSYEFTKQTICHAAVVHVKFFDITKDGSDQILDYERIGTILKDSGYNGYLSIEYDSQEPAVRDVPKIVKYLRKILE